MSLRDTALRALFFLALVTYLHSKCKVEIASEVALYRRTQMSKHCSQVPTLGDLPVSNRLGISCANVMRNDEHEIQLGQLKRLKAKASHLGASASWPDEAITNFIVKNSCESYVTARHFVLSSMSEEERAFPLAYSIVVHRGAGLVERLLRMIYRPQNFYCVHVDQKASASFFDAVSSIAKCFPNVFLVTKREDVIYTHFSRLQADLNCMQLLTSNSLNWKYFINLCGQDFPLKTNGEMVRYLRYLHPQNSIESFVLPEHKHSRYKWVFEVHETKGEYSKGLKRTNIPKSASPVNMTLFGGSAYMVATREFVDWALTNQTIQSIIDWSRDTYSPDEMLWATLSRLRGAPGFRHPHIKWDLNELQTVTRIVKWHALEEGAPVQTPPVYPRCHGYHKHGICVYGLGDVSWLMERRHFFANKFDDSPSYGDDLAIQCIEETLRNREIAEACLA